MSKKKLFNTENIEIVTINKFGKIIKKQEKQIIFILDESLDLFLDMVFIPGGKFTMGSPLSEKGSEKLERPLKSLSILTFLMSKYPITQRQWQIIACQEPFSRELPLKIKQHNSSKNNHPITNISWYEAIEFCARLSKKTNRKYYLPSEAQWEYACRAGTTTPFYFGETISSNLANYDGEPYAEEPKGRFREETTPVRSFPPNAFGLYDMHGNVWEWCADVWQDQYKQTEKIDFLRAQRGGSWASWAKACRSAYRTSEEPTDYSETIGFRVAATIDPDCLQSILRSCQGKRI